MFPKPTVLIPLLGPYKISTHNCQWRNNKHFIKFPFPRISIFPETRDETLKFKRRNKSTSFPQGKSLSALIWSYKGFKFFFMANIIAQEQKVKLKSCFLYLISSNLLNVHVCIAFLPKQFFSTTFTFLAKFHKKSIYLEMFQKT